MLISKLGVKELLFLERQYQRRGHPPTATRVQPLLRTARQVPLPVFDTGLVRLNSSCIRLSVGWHSSSPCSTSTSLPLRQRAPNRLALRTRPKPSVSARSWHKSRTRTKSTGRGASGRPTG